MGVCAVAEKRRAASAAAADEKSAHAFARATGLDSRAWPLVSARQRSCVTPRSPLSGQRCARAPRS